MYMYVRPLRGRVRRAPARQRSAAVRGVILLIRINIDILIIVLVFVLLLP